MDSHGLASPANPYYFLQKDVERNSSIDVLQKIRCAVNHPMMNDSVLKLYSSLNRNLKIAKHSESIGTPRHTSAHHIRAYFY